LTRRSRPGVIQRAHALGEARLLLALPRISKRGFKLDPRLSKKVSKKMIGRLLTTKKGQDLLKKFQGK
jgi:hypothetical protein